MKKLFILTVFLLTGNFVFANSPINYLPNYQDPLQQTMNNIQSFQQIQANTLQSQRQGQVNFVETTSRQASQSNYTKDEVERLTSIVPVGDNIYDCKQIAFNVGLLNAAVNQCGIKVNSATKTARTLCSSWANTKGIWQGRGAWAGFGEVANIEQEGQQHFQYTLQTLGKQQTCSKIKQQKSDFLVE